MLRSALYESHANEIAGDSYVAIHGTHGPRILGWDYKVLVPILDDPSSNPCSFRYQQQECYFHSFDWKGSAANGTWPPLL